MRGRHARGEQVEQLYSQAEGNDCVWLRLRVSGIANTFYSFLSQLHAAPLRFSLGMKL